jgi:hypothetical protein
MRQAILFVALALLAVPARGEILLQEDFEDAHLNARGWFDIAKWGEDKSLSIAGAPEVQAKTGQKCLKIRYALKDTGGWMHHAFKKTSEVYCRYYRLFPEEWEWPRGYGPHDTLLIAGSMGAPTDTDLSIYLDFWRTADTRVRVATSRQKWFYAGYGDKVLRKFGGVAHQLAPNVSPADRVELGKWHCVEYYCRLSGAGQDDGCLRLWVNGKLVGELDGIPNVDERHAGILFNRFMLGPYFHGGSQKVQWNYMDALVISTRYIGTVEQKGNQPPRARFTSTRDWGSLTAACDASRSADPEGRPLRYAWDFGDGKSGQGKTATHTYAAPGDYTVRLTVTDEKGETHAAERALSVGPEVGSGIGLKAEYYDGEAFEGRPILRAERRIDFKGRDWTTRYLRGEVGDFNGKNYSCRWTGFLQPTRSEEYTLTLDAVDGGRLWFDGKLVVDSWDKPGANAVSVGKLQAGRRYCVRVEQHHGPDPNRWEYRARLLWESPSTKKEPVPTTQLYLPEGFVEP